MIGGHGREFLGAARYEFRMQVRRRAVWITFGVLALLFMGSERRFWRISPNESVSGAVSHWALAVNLLLPIAVGVLLADRLPRDRQTHVDELFAALPVSFKARFWGKYIGSTLATILPFLAVYVAGVGNILAIRHDLTAIPLALTAFAVINLPGLLFVASFSIACPVVLWVPLYQFLFIGYWFWGNLMTPDVMPTLSQTWLAPIGFNAFFGFFHGTFNQYPNYRTIVDGAGSIALLLVCAAIPVVVAPWYLHWRQARV